MEALDPDGAIVTTEGFGNNPIDFAAGIEQIGLRRVPVVGDINAGHQGRLVVGNTFRDALVELNKDPAGRESEVLAETPSVRQRPTAPLGCSKPSWWGCRWPPPPPPGARR